MVKYVCLISAILLSVSCSTKTGRVEPVDDKERVANMMSDAAVYAQSLETLDIERLVELTLPAYVDMEGGKDRYLNKMHNSTFPKDDFSSISIVLEDRDILIKGENHCYYSVLQQKVSQQFKDALDDAPIVTEINIVAESQDGGKNWRFAFMRIPDLRQFYPDSIVEELSQYLEY